jgi:hypothetical protein
MGQVFEGGSSPSGGIDGGAAAFSDSGSALVDHEFFGELLQLEDDNKSEARFFNLGTSAQGSISP